MTNQPYLLDFPVKWRSYKVDLLNIDGAYRFQKTRPSQPGFVRLRPDAAKGEIDTGSEPLAQLMKRVLFLALLFLVSFLGAVGAEAANHYVRAGASGIANGNDWINAYTTLPATLTRGDTYYIADGVYGGYTFDDPVNGTTRITVKKATINDHGTATGWDNSFGNGQVVFTGQLRFKTSYWTLDGQTRDETNWFSGSAYGFAIDNNADQQIVFSNYGNAPSNITIQYVYIAAIVGNLPGNTIRRYAIDTDDFDGGSLGTGLIFSRMYVRGSNNVWFIRTTRGTIIEYSASDGAASNSANHGEIVNAYFSVYDATVRYNIFRNAYIGDQGTALIAISVSRNQAQKPKLDIYGNVFYNYHVGDGAIGFLGNSANGGNCTNCRVYNNTFAKSNTTLAIQFPDGSGNFVSNNIFMNIGSGTPICDIGSAGTISSNAFGPGSGGSCGGTNAQVGLPTSLFVDFAGGNFKLTSNTTSGVTLPAPYDRDILGASRVSGAWSRGAFQAATGGIVPPAAPTGLTVR